MADAAIPREKLSSDHNGQAATHNFHKNLIQAQNCKNNLHFKFPLFLFLSSGGKSFSVSVDSVIKGWKTTTTGVVSLKLHVNKNDKEELEAFHSSLHSTTANEYFDVLYVPLEVISAGPESDSK